ncbi:MAG TPA: DNA polymerase III subunit delta [Mycobacteriales bacterium]|nr:DNA polymerase III subunit delta [Mycobacteriales bacterium]HWA65160.1 DNA polymerase III subunit delta [Mycobacteriales bacterium]
MPSATVAVGEDGLLADRAVARAVAAVGPGTSIHDTTGAELTPDLLAELASPSLFAEPRVVVVRGLQDLAKDVWDPLARTLEDDSVELTLVGHHLGGVKGKALLDLLEGVGAAIVRLPRISSVRDREQFVVDEVKAAGGRIDRDAAVELVAAIGNDLREIATACGQLVADVGPAIGLSDVATYYRGRAESSGFAVADRAVEGNAAAAIETLRWAYATGLDPILVSSSLAANLRLIAQVGAAGAGSPDAVAGRLGLPAWKVRRAQDWLRRWRPDALARAVRAVAAADADLKGAADDAAYAVERAVLAVAAAANSPA